MFKTNIMPGDIVSLADSDGNHIGIVLSINKDDCKLLLCTSNPYWNEFSRRLSSDERKYFSNIFFNKNKATYFAPVKRSIRNVYNLGGSFPEHRVQALLDEFSEGFEIAC